MAYVITRSCCNDASCVAVCPVNCIHPTPDEPDFGTSEMLYIDPAGCIDCGACVPACPVNAVVADFDIMDRDISFADLNASYFTEPDNQDYPGAQYNANRPTVQVEDRDRLRVAIVGSGPAGCYAAEELLARRGLGADVHMFERLPVPWGLVRSGVAPDHQDTKLITKQFSRTLGREAMTLYLNVEVGRDITHEELAANFHAVIYAVGAAGDRKLDIPGEDLPGIHPATDFVSWYNGHPDFAGRVFDVSAKRAVVIGNGNVALDVARILASDIDRLRRTDIADHAITALAESQVEEVVVIGRRGPHQAAFSTPELIALSQQRDIQLSVDLTGVQEEVDRSPIAGYRSTLLRRLADCPTPGSGRRLVLRFLASPVEVHGTDRVTGLRVVRNELLVSPHESASIRATDVVEEIATGLVLRSIGYRGSGPPGVPFDADLGIIANAGGRVVRPSGHEQPGVYATGWIKRGPSGVIGTNKRCAQGTVDLLIEDYLTGRLPTPYAPVEDLQRLLVARNPHVLDYQDWLAVDRQEVAAGRVAKRPRVKLVDRHSIVDVAAAARSAAEARSLDPL